MGVLLDMVFVMGGVPLLCSGVVVLVAADVVILLVPPLTLFYGILLLGQNLV